MDESLQELAEHVSAALPNEVIGTEIRYGELMLRVRRDAVVKVMTFLRDDSACQFRMLADLTAVDYPERDERFEVVYNLLSLQLNQRIRVKVTTDEATPVPSVTGLYPAANWAEREVWDLYGVAFSEHPDLRRLMTDYGFQGHPLRKDFPLTGYVQVRYDPEQRRVVQEPVELSQEFRNFDFLSPWEGLNTLFPGDEKAHTPETPDEEGRP